MTVLRLKSAFAFVICNKEEPVKTTFNSEKSSYIFNYAQKTKFRHYELIKVKAIPYIYWCHTDKNIYTILFIYQCEKEEIIISRYFLGDIVVPDLM